MRRVTAVIAAVTPIRRTAENSVTPTYTWSCSARAPRTMSRSSSTDPLVIDPSGLRRGLGRGQALAERERSRLAATGDAELGEDV